MRQGAILERGAVAATFAAPRHPYTVSLLEDHHSVDRDSRTHLGPWLASAAGAKCA